MLMLSRKVGETIVIADGITVTVIEVRDGKVRLGVDAPRQVPVWRGEIYENIQAGLPPPKQ